MLGQRINLAVDAESTRDPRTALVLYNRKFEKGERVNPKLPDFGEVLLGTDYHGIVDVCKHVDFERGEMGKGLNFGAEVINGIFQKEAEKGCGETFTLKHAIDYFKGFVIHVPYWHV